MRLLHVREDQSQRPAQAQVQRPEVHKCFEVLLGGEFQISRVGKIAKYTHQPAWLSSVCATGARIEERNTLCAYGHTCLADSKSKGKGGLPHVSAFVTSGKEKTTLSAASPW